jgi:hypothetical protein
MYMIVVYGDTHRQVLQPLRVGLDVTTRFLFAGASVNATPSFLSVAGMLG